MPGDRTIRKHIRGLSGYEVKATRLNNASEAVNALPPDGLIKPTINDRETINMALLAIDGNAKTVKGQKYGVLTGILYMAPNTQSGVTDTCPMADVAGCKKACLYSAGRGRFNNVQAGRIRKTVLFHEHYDDFMNELARDISKLVRKATREGAIPMVRLNGTSDILWEAKSFKLREREARLIGKESGEYPNIMALFPDVQFYDYTKIAMRFKRDLPANYDLTFSYSGVKAYAKHVEIARQHGARMAVVFLNEAPATYLGMRVVDGDEHDIRPYNPQGVVVALKAKGDAKKDKTGFVVSA